MQYLNSYWDPLTRIPYCWGWFFFIWGYSFRRRFYLTWNRPFCGVKTWNIPSIIRENVNSVPPLLPPEYRITHATRHLQCLIETEWRIYICVSKLTTIVWDNGLSPGRHQATICTNGGLSLIRTLGTNFSGILSEIDTFSFKKCRQRNFVPASVWYTKSSSLQMIISSCSLFTRFKTHSQDARNECL